MKLKKNYLTFPLPLTKERTKIANWSAQAKQKRVKIKNEKRYRDNKNILIDCLIGKNMNYDNISCFNVDNSICFSINNMDEKHPKSFQGKDTNLTVNKYKKTFMDFAHKKIGEKLSAGNLSSLLKKKMINGNAVHTFQLIQKLQILMQTIFRSQF